MESYPMIQFKCPTCRQRLAVLRGQVDRGEVVTCQSCNTDLALTARGKGGPARARAPGAAAIVELG